MSENKSIVDRYGDEVLTDNSKIIKFRQCIDCVHRADRGTALDWLGFQKQFCRQFDGERTPFKPLEFSLDEDDPEYMECLLYCKDTDEESE